jgi:hypothetical protein
MNENPTVRLSICKTCGGIVRAYVISHVTPEAEQDFKDEVKQYDLEEKMMTLYGYRESGIKSCACKIEEPINWSKLRDAYFAECVENGQIAMTPHELFEWMKNEITEYLKK